jgi:hypothetical protein
MILFHNKVKIKWKYDNFIKKKKTKKKLKTQLPVNQMEF